MTNTEYGIHEGENLVSDAYGSRFAAEYELDHRTAPGGVWPSAPTKTGSRAARRSSKEERDMANLEE